MRGKGEGQSGTLVIYEKRHSILFAYHINNIWPLFLAILLQLLPSKFDIKYVSQRVRKNVNSKEVE